MNETSRPEGGPPNRPPHSLTTRRDGKRRRRVLTLPFSAREEAELRRLVWHAFDLRGEPGYREALEAIERWYVETLPDALARLEGGAG